MEQRAAALDAARAGMAFARQGRVSNTAGKTPLGAFPALAPAPASDAPHYAAIGGAEGVAQLVERFYFYMEQKPCAAAIRAMHPQDLSGSKALLNGYLTEWFGGERAYSKGRGHPRLRQRHKHFAIGESERKAWMVCMRAALAEVVSDDELRKQLEVAFDRLADSVRNIGELAAHRHEGKHHHE